MTEESHTGSGEPDASVGLVACETCTHPLAVHSREPGIGCLHRVRSPRILRVLALVDDDGTCDCQRAGTSEADQ